MVDIKKVADNAEMIVNGYAFIICEQGIRVLNLNNPDSAALLTNDNGVLETSMDDIEIQIVKDYLKNNRKFMEE